MATFAGYNPNSMGKVVPNEGTFASIANASGDINVAVDNYPQKRAWINHENRLARAHKPTASIRAVNAESSTVTVHFTTAKSGSAGLETEAAGSAAVSGDSYVIWVEGN